MAVVGIDLGTTNTVVAAVRDGRATALKDNRGRALLPSVVTLPAEGEPVVGYDAKENRSRDAENTIFSIKRLIGRSWESEHVQKARQRFPFELKEGPGKATLVRSRGADYTLPEISALVLERARAIAEERLGEPVNEVVITVPANFNDLQRAATKVAARVAGLEVLRILNEPTAAALAYGFGKKGRERIAVYDFGGGTFDITLLDLSQNVFEVLATAGDTFLGGDDIDVAIVEAMADELKRKHGVDTDKHASVREQLRLAAEKLKIDLSTRSMAKVLVEDIGHGRLSKKIDFEFSMKRADFEKLCEPWVERTLVVCQEALNIAGIGTKDLDQVLLVGGSTRIPLVRRRVSSFFGKMPQSRVNPDEVVAIGAAIQAAALESKSASLLPPETHKSSRPPAARSQFPSSPGVTTGTLARPGAGGTKTGLAGLRKTMPGTGGDAPAAADATREGSILSALPRASAATRPDMPAVRLPQREDDGDDRGPRTLMGVGEPDPGAVGGPAPKPPGAGLPEGTGRNYKTLAGVGPDGSPLMAAGPTGPTTFKTLTGSPTGTGPLPLKTLSGVAPGPRTGPGNVKTGPLKTLSGVGSPLEEPSAGRATSGSTLSRLPGLSDSRSTSGSTLSKLGPSDGRSASSLPPRGPALSTPSSSDFEEITSIYPATPSVAPPSELSPLRTASQRPAASPAPVVPAPAAKTPAAPAAVVPAAPATATATAKASPAAGESSHDPFADLPASDDDLDLPSAVPPPAATDGSVIFDFADLTEDEPDAPSHGPEDEVDLPARSTRGLDLPAQGFDATRIGGTNADLPARPAAAEFEPTVARREPAAARPAALDLPAAKPMDLPAARAPDLPAARGPGLPAARAPDLPAGRAPGLPAQRMPVPLAAAPSGDLDTDELSLSAIALDDLEAEAAELDTDEFAPPSSGSLDLSDQLGGTRLGVAPPAAPPLAGPAAMGAPPESLRTALGPNAFDAALERTALGPSAAAPISASTLGAARPAGAPVERAAPLARTALGVAPPAQNWDRTSPAGTAPTEEGVAVRRDATGALQAPLLIDVTPLSLGVETVGGYVDQLIERNSPIPCERTRTFATARDEQTLVRVRVSQGEANRFEANTVLGEVELSGLSPGPRGSVKVDVTFSLDESGMLQVAARDTRTGQKANAVLRLVGLSAHGS